jgi:chaperone modulatory protein CbpM
MDASPHPRGNTVWPWLLDRDLVYAITGQKRMRREAHQASCPTTGGAESTEFGAVSPAELALLTGASARDLLLLVDSGVLNPLDLAADPWEFRASLVPVLRRAQRMREDLALNSDEFALAMLLLMEIDKIEAELRFARVWRRSGFGHLTAGAEGCGS